MILTVRVPDRTAGNGRRRGALRGQGIDPGFNSLDPKFWPLILSNFARLRLESILIRVVVLVALAAERVEPA